jgi:hypothetical protein
VGPAEVRDLCRLDEAGKSLLRAAMKQLYMSARAHHRILKLAQAIRIREMALSCLADVDAEETAVDVHAELDTLQVKEVWDRAGPSLAMATLTPVKRPARWCKMSASLSCSSWKNTSSWG